MNPIDATQGQSLTASRQFGDTTVPVVKDGELLITGLVINSDERWPHAYYLLRERRQ